MSDIETRPLRAETTDPPSWSSSPAAGAAAVDLDERRALGTVLERLMGRPTEVRVGRYELGERIGTGGCGAVYAAWDPKLDRKVAIKVVLPSLAGGVSGESEARLLREAQALARLRDPNIVEIFDLGANGLGRDRRGRERRGVFIVMELLEGATLRAWIRTGPPTSAIVDAFVQAARGLAAAHAVGVVHRDFKPANAIITADGRVKVLDFGLAREELEPFVSHTPTGPYVPVSGGSGDSLTRTGMVMGTPRYMAPEQHGAEPVTTASDQYSLCVALWEALRGAPPFRAQDIALLAEHKREGPPPRPESMSRALYRVLARGLDPDPTRRFPQMDALAAQLARAQRPPRHWAFGIAAAGATVLAMGAALAAPAEPALCHTPDPVDGWTARFDTAVATTRAQSEARSSMPRRVEARLRRFADGWTAAHASVCDRSATVTADRVDRARCIERAAAALHATLSLLESPEPSAAGATDSAAASQVPGRRRLFSLPVPSRCLTGDPGALYRRDDATEAELDELSALATAVLGGERPADAPETIAAIDTALARVDEIDDAWVATRLLLARIHGDVYAGRSTEAARGATEAIWRAEAAGDPLLGAEIVATAVAHLMDADAPEADMRRLFEHGDDLLRAAGDPPELRVELEVVEAMDAARRGRFEDAKRLADAAIERAGDPPLPGTERLVALAMVNVSAIRADHGEPEAARRMLARVLAMGLDDEPWYPFLAGFAHDVIAAIDTIEGDIDGALAESIAQQHWLARAAGPEHPAVIYATARYGRMLVWQGADTEGVALMERAYDRILDTQGSMDLKLGYIAGELAAAEGLRGHDAAMLRWARRGLEHDKVRLHEDNPEIAGTWALLADAQARAGELADAEVSLGRALDVAAADDAYTVARAASVRAAIALRRGRFAAAREDAEAAIAALGAPEAMPTSEGLRGEIHLQLAAALHGQGELDAARGVQRLADEALARGTFWHRRMITD